MTSFAIIAENPEKVNLEIPNFGAFAPKFGVNTSSVVAAKRCESFDPSIHATNEWTTLRMSFEWHGDDVASFDDQIHTLIERNATTRCAVFRPISQPKARVIMCADLLDSIIARTTYDLTTHNGEISFVNGKVIRFRAVTVDDGQRVIQEKRGKKWKHFGDINPDGTVTPIIPSHLPEVAADNDRGLAEVAANAQREIKIIQAKANLINDPMEKMSDGVAVSFKGSCRCCNRTLKNPQSVANGIGPTCAKKQSQAAVAIPTTSMSSCSSQSLAPSPVSTSYATSDAVDWSHPQLQDAGSDSKALPLTAEQVLFCTSQLGALGCSHAEIEQFFDDLLAISPYWYPNFSSEAAKYDKSPAFLYDVCDAFVDSVTPIDEYVRIARQLFHYRRFGSGYEFITCMGSRGGEIVELVAYPHEVQKVMQELAWA